MKLRRDEIPRFDFCLIICYIFKYVSVSLAQAGEYCKCLHKALRKRGFVFDLYFYGFFV